MFHPVIRLEMLEFLEIHLEGHSSWFLEFILDNSISFPRLVVFCLLLLLSCFFGCLFFFFFANKHETRRKKINKRYEEVDGVRKEKERLTNDHRSQGHVIFS